MHPIFCCRLVRSFLACVLVPFLLNLGAGERLAADEISFNRDIRPLLSDHCFACHGPDEEHRSADLRLDVEEDAKHSAIVAGDADASDLVDRITSDDPDSVMPPPEANKPLNKSQIELLRRWIEAGANYEPHWAYVSPKNSPTPKVSAPDWVSDPIDAFVLKSLDAQGMKPSIDADPVTLIRRVSFDLTGLPPSLRDVEQFARNPSQETYRRYVDQLLASSAFGERMAVYWLDLVRYADTVGYHGDQDHSISPYRDYVIDALNANMPLDQFAREQLAGDLLEQPTTDQLIASGYNRLLQTSHEGGVQPKEYLAIYAADRVRNFSNVWMGATVGCAQCHDHKYDPYTAEDFYSLSAFFADIDESQHFKSGTNSLPTKRFPEISVLSNWQRDWAASLDVRIRRLEKTGNQPKELAALKEERKSIDGFKRVTMISKAIKPRNIRVLPRGNWLDDTGPIVHPTAPMFMRQVTTREKRASRLDLAEWLFDQKHGIGGLTARVFSNRLWYLMFGRGISSSLADFGGQGQPPTHPELLDRLSIDFLESGWDVKYMLRRMALSRTYQQSSVVTPKALERDPYNQWLGRQSRFRLPAEMVRDNALMISGLLNGDVGGPSAKPFQPTGYYRHLNFPTRQYKPDVGAAQWRRGVYTHWQRQFLHPMLKAMDAPSREECTAERPRSNTPLEALVLMNDPSMVRSAVAMANRLMASDGDSDQRLRLAFRWATSREPDLTEMSVLRKALANERGDWSANPESVQQLLSTVPVHSSEDLVEVAAWTGVCRTVMNMYETVTRN